MNLNFVDRKEKVSKQRKIAASRIKKIAECEEDKESVDKTLLKNLKSNDLKIAERITKHIKKIGGC